MPIRLGSYSYYGEVVRVESKGSMLLTETVYEPGMRLPSHSHETHHLAILLEGSYLESVGSRSYLCLPGDAVHYNADVQHENRFGQTAGRCLNLEFPHDRAPSEYQANRTLMPAEVQTLIHSKKKTTADTKWLNQARQKIDSNPASSLTPLAEELSVHPNSLAKAFRRAFGLSVGQYIRLQRARLAAKMLIESELSLAEIAFDCGFFDQSHLTNAFHQLTGFTPAGLRRLAHN